MVQELRDLLVANKLLQHGKSVRSSDINAPCAVCDVLRRVNADYVYSVKPLESYHRSSTTIP